MLIFIVWLATWAKSEGHKDKSEERRKWHYLAVKKLFALLRGITSKHRGDFYCLNCLHSFRTKNRLESHKRACENKGFCHVIMPSDDTRILEFNQYEKYDKAKFIIYEDLECIIEKNYGCKNNPQNSSATKVSEHIPSGFSMSKISSFRSIENKHDVFRGKDCMKRFCEFLREHAMKIIDFRKKRSRNHMKIQKSVIFVKKKLKINLWKMKNIVKLEIIAIIQENIEMLHITHVI